MPDIVNTVKQLGTKDAFKRKEQLLSMLKCPYEIQTDGYTSNIILPAAEKTNKLVLTAHYDAYPGSLGYNDNACGVAVLLKLQDLAGPNIEIVFTDKEERNGLGSRLYLEEYAESVSASINLDVVGVGTHIHFEEYVEPFGSIEEGEFVVRSTGIPFNDSHIFRCFGIPSLLISAGNGTENFVNEIWRYQHGNELDNQLDLISPAIVEQIYKFVRNLLENYTRQGKYLYL